MKRVATLMLLGSLLLSTHAIFAEDRHIHVNGQCLEAEQMAQLDQVVGGQTPNGFYWIDFNSGAWGYEGNETIQGYLSAPAGAQGEQSAAGGSSSGERPYMESSITGRVVSGQVNGQDCTYVSVGGTTVRSCD
ncbi:MAG: hypothetical protein ABW092_21315 [Candidatus Thiodiazotropha sp.]